VTNYNVLEIPVEKLLLDLNNPRHDVLENQTDALREMIIDQADKLVNLARDIIEKGINPSELTIVTPDDGSIDEYVVLEGNRRLAALKLLTNPSLADLGKKPSVGKFFDESASKFNENPIDVVRCVVFDHRDDATHWIELKHTGQNKGIGVVEWDSESVARFKQRLGKPSLALQVVEFVKKNTVLSDDEKKNLDGVHLTNISRLVNDPDVRNALGIGVDEGDVVTNLPPQEVVKGLTKIVTDVADGVITVNDIRHKRDRQTYLEQFTPKELPSPSSPAIKSWNIQSQPNPVTPVNGAVGSKSAKKSLPLSSNRKTLIPARCVLRISHQRINKIYRELRGLEVDDYPNSCAVMLRVFLELSLDEYTKAKAIELPKDPSLLQKLQKTAEFLENSGTMTKNELKQIRVAYSSPDALFSTNTLNAYVHNKDFSPKSKDLKETWDSMQHFLEVLWP
jgi:hypothetical protein